MTVDKRVSSTKSADAFRTISEVSKELDVPQHVLRFWESKFSQVNPLKRGGGRRYYRASDIRLLTRIRDLLYVDGFTIKGVQRVIKERGLKALLSNVSEPDLDNNVLVPVQQNKESLNDIASMHVEISKVIAELFEIRKLLLPR